MKRLIELPDAAFLQACFRYEPETGKLFWKERPKEHFPSSPKYWERFNKLTAGKEIGIKLSRPNGDPLCLRIKMHWMGKKLFPSVHRVIFKMLEIEVPDNCVIDHIDGNPWNNRMENLRVATHSQNTCNARKMTCVQMLPKGVSFVLGRFKATCMIHGKSKIIGKYKTAEEAHKAYCDYASEVHGEFFRAS